MNTKKIEEIAVAAVRNEILRNDLLSDEIPVNDKTPSWDGEIWVYNNKKQKKSDLFGKIPVQVKGKKVTKMSKEETKFPIQKVDLENYLMNGGILYFVIEMIDSDNTQIFYLSLLPIDINKILNEMKEQKSITKRFKKLQSTHRALEFISRNFILHSRKQSISLIKDIKGNEFDTFSTKIILPSMDNITEDLFKFDTYIYGHIKKINLDIPLYKMDLQKLIEETDLTIGLEGKIIYNEVTRVYEKEKINLEFGKSFVIELPKVLKSAEQIKINFKEKGTIQERIKDCCFMLELIKNKSIEINKNKLELNNFDKKDKFLKEIPSYIKYLKEISETFQKLDITFESDLNTLTKDDIRKIEILRDTILYQNYERLNLSSSYLRFHIGELNIALVCLEDNNQRLVFNFFDLDAINHHRFNIKFREEDKNDEVSHSPYIIFEPSELFSMSNLNMKVIEASLKGIDYDNELSFNLTNNYALNLLKYYDHNKNKKEVLDLILNIFTYLYSIQPDNILYFMNKMQTIKRKREFTAREKTEIINLKNLKQHADEILCGFYILLDSKIEFEIQFNKLNKDQREAFIKYPIYDLVFNKKLL